MGTEAGTWPIGEDGAAAVRKILDQLAEIDEATGGWSAKADVRQTGVSYHARFERKADVLAGGQMFVTMLEKSPGLLADACRRLLAAHEAHVDLGDLAGHMRQLGWSERMIGAAMDAAGAEAGRG